MMCIKCRGGKARAHHRACPKRGACHRGRAERIRAVMDEAMTRANRALDEFNAAMVAFEAQRRMPPGYRVYTVSFPVGP